VAATAWRRARAPPRRGRAARGSQARVPPQSFSAANGPAPGRADLAAVTRVPDGETSTGLHERLRVGEKVSLSGPYGTFVDDPTSTGPALFLAAGSGLAPIHALLEAAVTGTTRSSLALIFSAHSEADVIDHDRFATCESHHPSFRFIGALTRDAGPPPRGRVHALVPQCTQTAPTKMCSSRVRPHSCWPVRPLLTRSVRATNAYTPRCSSSSRSRGRAGSRGRRQASECEAHRRDTADLHQDRRGTARPAVRRAQTPLPGPWAPDRKAPNHPRPYDAGLAHRAPYRAVQPDHSPAGGSREASSRARQQARLLVRVVGVCRSHLRSGRGRKIAALNRSAF
jgi:NAD(P)H-flavin reductase